MDTFSHNGNEDFKRKLLEKGSLLVSCDKYVYQKGETARMQVQSGFPLASYAAKMNGVPVPVVEKEGKYLVEVPLLQAGEVRLDFFYNGGKQTHASLLVVNSERELLENGWNLSVCISR